jgi:4'-phosphopantetheinyl transferase
MPVFFNKIIANEIHLLVWQIDESLEIIRNAYFFEPPLWEEAMGILNEKKQIEFLVSRLAIQAVCELNSIEFKGIVKDEHGKPYLAHSVYEMSVSHTKHFVGVVLRPHLPVGIDIETPQAKMFKILSRLCVPSEVEIIGQSVEKASLFWSGKEALYKLYGKRKVDFKTHLRLFYEDSQLKGSIAMPDCQQTFDFYVEALGPSFIVVAY